MHINIINKTIQYFVYNRIFHIKIVIYDIIISVYADKKSGSTD